MNNKFPKVIIFNAPPQSGKDTCAEYCCQFLPSVHNRFKDFLMVMAARILKIPFKTFLEFYDSEKDIEDKIRCINFYPSHEFINENMQSYSVREFMIHLSEYVMKPIFGNMFFGLEAGKKLSNDKWNIFSDGGFPEEIKGLLEYTCKENIIVVKIQRDGCSFENDSRGWIDESLVGETIVIPNNDSLEELFLRLDYLIENVFIGKE